MAIVFTGNRMNRMGDYAWEIFCSFKINQIGGYNYTHACDDQISFRFLI